MRIWGPQHETEVNPGISQNEPEYELAKPMNIFKVRCEQLTCKCRQKKTARIGQNETNVFFSKLTKTHLQIF